MNSFAGVPIQKRVSVLQSPFTVVPVASLVAVVFPVLPRQARTGRAAAREGRIVVFKG